MEETEQIIGLSRAKKMKALAFSETSQFFWWVFPDGMTSVKDTEPAHEDGTVLEQYPAYSVSELDHMIEKIRKDVTDFPIDDPRLKTVENKANNRADILIELATK